MDPVKVLLNKPSQDLGMPATDLVKYIFDATKQAIAGFFKSLSPFQDEVTHKNGTSVNNCWPLALSHNRNFLKFGILGYNMPHQAKMHC